MISSDDYLKGQVLTKVTNPIRNMVATRANSASGLLHKWTRSATFSTRNGNWSFISSSYVISLNFCNFFLFVYFVNLSKVLALARSRIRLIVFKSDQNLASIDPASRVEHGQKLALATHFPMLHNATAK
ncbi:hypothetical protein BpHYR1_006906 [Brachionus plicatilis]|uniref:Uncharacterized protein n=1 Tax=Brachionus plicatilis TaxID=10195 RepID=A0A3M7QSJ0_BRAPC|nr:hypothetical protein BpHYR1_006906 [Brachionus plicatilis]